MSEVDRDDLRRALKINVAAGTAAMRGIIALCNELSRGKLLDDAAVDKVEDFMLRGLPLAGISEDDQQEIAVSIQDQFADLRRRLR